MLTGVDLEKRVAYLRTPKGFGIAASCYLSGF